MDAKKYIAELIKQVRYAPFPGSLKASVADQLPDHAIDAIAEHLLANSVAALPFVKLIELTHHIGPYELEEVALFNINHISEENAKDCIASGEYNQDVLIIPKAQWLALFRDEGVCMKQGTPGSKTTDISVLDK